MFMIGIVQNVSYWLKITIGNTVLSTTGDKNKI